MLLASSFTVPQSCFNIFLLRARSDQWISDLILKKGVTVLHKRTYSCLWMDNDDIETVSNTIQSSLTLNLRISRSLDNKSIQIPQRVRFNQKCRKLWRTNIIFTNQDAKKLVSAFFYIYFPAILNLLLSCGFLSCTCKKFLSAELYKCVDNIRKQRIKHVKCW